LKLNFDGLAIAGRRIDGGVVRNNIGKVVISYARKYGGGRTNNEVGSLALVGE